MLWLEECGNQKLVLLATALPLLQRNRRSESRTESQRRTLFAILPTPQGLFRYSPFLVTGINPRMISPLKRLILAPTPRFGEVLLTADRPDQAPFAMTVALQRLISCRPLAVLLTRQQKSFQSPKSLHMLNGT